MFHTSSSMGSKYKRSEICRQQAFNRQARPSIQISHGGLLHAHPLQGIVGSCLGIGYRGIDCVLRFELSIFSDADHRTGGNQLGVGHHPCARVVDGFYKCTISRRGNIRREAGIIPYSFLHCNSRVIWWTEAVILRRSRTVGSRFSTLTYRPVSFRRPYSSGHASASLANACSPSLCGD